jgi:hypothetical protein
MSIEHEDWLVDGDEGLRNAIALLKRALLHYAKGATCSMEDFIPLSRVIEKNRNKEMSYRT